MTTVQGFPLAAGAMGGIMLYIGAIIVIMYFFMLRPQKKKEQARRKMIENVNKGDRIVTIGGIHGEVVNAKGRCLIIQVDPDRKTTLKINRGAIHRVLTEGESGEEEEQR